MVTLIGWAAPPNARSLVSDAHFRVASVLAILLAALWALGQTAASGNGSVDLRPHLCAMQAELSAPGEPRAVACTRPSEAVHGSGWTWSRLDDPRRLDSLEGEWHLLLPHRDLDAVVVDITYRDRTTRRLARHGGALAVDWSQNGHASFSSSRPGRDVAALSIGSVSSSGRAVLTRVEAVSADIYGQRLTNFHVVVGLFLGTVGSALIYNLFVGAGSQHRFQRIYVMWCILALVNGMLASGMMAALWAPLAGEAGILFNRIVVDTLVVTGTLFLLALIEPGILPPGLVRLGQACAALLAATIPITALGPPHPLDLAGPLVTGLNLALALAASAVALRRRSRAIRFYLLGWSPLLLFAPYRLGYDLGFMPQTQLLELGGMLAIAFESVVLSLAIADRFRQLQRERDALELAQHRAQVEQAALQRVADTDPMTGLSNRRVFEAALAAAQRGEYDQLALILIDVDHFKAVNDRFGHDEGDELLCDVAKQLRASVRANDLVARLGGDEFALLVRGADARHVDQIIESLIALQRHDRASGAGRVTFSIGATLYPDDEPDPARLYKNADLALYEAKRLGRARHHRYSPKLRSREEERLSADLAEATGAAATGAAMPFNGNASTPQPR